MIPVFFKKIEYKIFKIFFFNYFRSQRRVYEAAKNYKTGYQQGNIIA